jgi:DNA-binding response OmpR family regulator
MQDWRRVGLQNEVKRVQPGLRVLLVEDEPLIAIDGDDMLRAMGVDDVIWVRSVTEGENALGSATFHAALLDLRLGQESSLPLAQRLAAKNIPFGFLTGFQDNAIPQEFRDRPLVVKPFTAAQLGALLSGLVGPPA